MFYIVSRLLLPVTQWMSKAPRLFKSRCFKISIIITNNSSVNIVTKLRAGRPGLDTFSLCHRV